MDQKVKKDNGKNDQVWVWKEKTGEHPVADFTKGETSKMGEM